MVMTAAPFARASSAASKVSFVPPEWLQRMTRLLLPSFFGAARINSLLVYRPDSTSMLSAITIQWAGYRSTREPPQATQ